MTNSIFNNICKIIERDSKSTTYKYALLRGVIEIIQDNSPYISFENNKVSIPTGLLIEKWILYYYPLLESKTLIPQINGENNLAFSTQLNTLILFYKSRGGYSAFYNDLKYKGIPEDIQSNFFELAKKLRDTITKMPMKYIGRSFSNNYYSIFSYKSQKLKNNSRIDFKSLINDFGCFTIPYEYFEAFKFLGSFINGQDSIIFRWAEFSVSASGNNLSINDVLNEVIKSPITSREIKESKKLYKDILSTKGQIYCVWTGRKIFKYDIDHLIPFSVWKNNDLWNLLPSDSKINNQKRDKIPTPEIIEKQKSLITNYWEVIYEYQSTRFEAEMQVSLLGNHDFHLWQTKGIEQLQNSCNYLIENRGYQGWKI